MRLDGDRDREVEMLLEALEELAGQYQRLYGSSALSKERKRQSRKKQLKEGHVFDAAAAYVREKRIGAQNRSMQAAMEARREPDEREEVCPKRFSDCRIVVYTCLFGAYDTIREPLIQPDNIDYCIITDQPVDAQSRFQLMPADVIPAEANTDVLKNRWAKMHPHLLFPEYEYSIYLDANCWIVSDLTPLTATLEEYPVAFFWHKRRDCVYDEVDACVMQQKDDPQALEAHRALLAEHGVPRHGGLLEATVIARKHHDNRSVQLMDAWWQEFVGCSKRDQIGLVDCAWRLGIAIRDLAGLARCGVGRTISECKLFLVMPHR